jgi:hypothetical protein
MWIGPHIWASDMSRISSPTSSSSEHASMKSESSVAEDDVENSCSDEEGDQDEEVAKECVEDSMARVCHTLFL